MDSLKGKVAILTGASSGIGAGVAIHLAGHGCKLLLTGKTQEKLDKVATECRKSGLSADDVDTLSGDITTHATRMLVIEKAIERWDKIDILFNNSGIMCNMSLVDVSKVDYDLTFDNNVRCHVLMAKAALPHLVKTKGCIINNSSSASVNASVEQGVFCMTKAALDMFTKCFAREVGPLGVRVNSINPGIIDTHLERRKDDRMKEDAFYHQWLDANAGSVPLGRTGNSLDCAKAVAFLASDAASYVTGQTLFVDGGRNIVAVEKVKVDQVGSR
ncbi:3-oxoacyl-[acyl-carrier-protein] reductase FabG-like [Dreissena polymorpha]|uniref:Uncharacterized protein n=1 Tax=Dreissena polymorpha TaxID=45954 RepID=A0A9D4FAA5_DREPO|nr:3-oxoacyl-[acyl-carrier-protein] reductase FabG-like [Dreissena polymorpha]KAH3792926.1 hypothetical protein DPMN_146427 [Dreissena polymorpha]